MCFIFFGALLFFLIHGFRTSTGPFSTCNENSSDESAMTLPIDYSQKDTITRSQQTFVTPLHISALQSSAQLKLGH
jgi:hypothetical protein